MWVWLLAATSAALAAGIERHEVFTADSGGYAIYRIPGIVVTGRGSVLAYCEARKSDRGDWNAIDIVMRRSADGGRTFDAMRSIASVPGPHQKNPVALAQGLAATGDVTYNNPVMIPDRRRSDVVHMVFNLEYMRAFYQRSENGGRSWSKPVEITAALDPFRPEYDWKVLATGPGHGIQLRNGRLLIPIWLSTGTGGHAHRPSVVATIFSDNGGAGWQRGEIAIPNTEEWVNPNETALVELSDGRVMLNARSESKARRRLVSISADGARGWSRPVFDDALPEPICFGSLARHPLAGLLFINPDNPVDRLRRNVTVRLSRDGGQTWPVKRSLEPGGSGYADIAVAKDGAVLSLYERNEEIAGRWRTQALVLARFAIDWLTEVPKRRAEPNSLSDESRRVPQ